MANCPYCGIEVQESLKFCTNCGASLEGVQLIGAEPAPVQPPIEVPAQQPAFEQPYQPPQGAAQQPYGQAQPDAQQSYQQPQPAQFASTQAAPVDSGSIGWGVLGFFFPLVGLILFLVWKNTKPNSAKVAGIGAIIGFALGLCAQFFMQ